MTNVSCGDESGLPHYDNPPIVETILGVQFDRLAKFTNGHLGRFWLALGEGNWPQVIDAAPIGSQFEQFSEQEPWATALKLQLTQNPASRIQLKSSTKDRMVQLQNGRLHLNWLGHDNPQDYPRFPMILDEFTAVWTRFREFIKAGNLGDVSPNQWEVTYINQIPLGTIWNTPQDWTFFKPLNGIPSTMDMFVAESFVGEWHFVIPNQRGRLHIDWAHLRSLPKREFVQLSFTARGPIEPSSGTALVDGLKLGRSTIVKAFRNLMSDEANRFWGLKK